MKVMILSSRPWFLPYAERLKKRFGENLLFIGDPSQLNEARVAEFAPDLIFVPFWSHKIPAAIWKKHECIIFHMTDLPFGRGGSPLQNLIARGIYQTKISAIRCEEAFDAGEVYLKRDFDLSQGSAQELFERAAGIIFQMIVDITDQRPNPQPQAGSPTFFKRRTAAESDISQLDSIDKINDYIRMLDADGYPKAFLKLGPVVYEFSKSKKQDDGSLVCEVTIRTTT